MTLDELFAEIDALREMYEKTRPGAAPFGSLEVEDIACVEVKHVDGRDVISIL